MYYEIWSVYFLLCKVVFIVEYKLYNLIYRNKFFFYYHIFCKNSGLGKKEYKA